MRRLAVVVVVAGLCSLACGGGSKPDTSAAGVGPAPSPEPVEVAEPATPAPEPLAEGAFVIATFEPDGAGCAVKLLQVGTTETRPVGTLPGACPEETWERVFVSVHPKGGHVLISSPGGAIEGEPGKMTALGPVPAGFSTDRVGFDATSGKVVAIGQFDGPGTTSDPDEEGNYSVTWDVNGEPFKFDAGMYDLDPVLCGEFEWDGSAWNRVQLMGFGLAEGMSPPWCVGPISGRTLQEVSTRPSSGGHGTFLEPLTEQPGEPEGEWARFGVTFAGRPSEWLEGQTQLTPLYYTDTDGKPWIQIPGFDEGGVLALDERDRYAIACTSGHAAVLDTAASAGVVWTGAFCPVVWPALE